MKKITLCLFSIFLIISLSSCMTAKSDGASEYSVTEVQAEIPSRDVSIPATIVIPEGKEQFPLVVLAHGHGGTKDENGGFSNIAEELGKHGIATVRMDFPGCGDSSESFQLNTVSNMIDDVNASIDYVMANYPVSSTQIGIFGYSMGGRIALQMVNADAERFKGLVLLAPAADDKTMVDFLGGQDEWDRYHEIAKQDGFAEFTTIYGATQELSLAWFEELEAVTPINDITPFGGEALVIYGEDDNVVSPEVSKAVAEKLGSEALDVTGDTHSYSFYSDSPDIRAEILDGIVSTFLAAFM